MRDVKRSSTLTWLVLATLGPGACAAPTEPLSQRIDAIVEGTVADGHVAGVAVAVVRGEGVVHAKGYGLADIEGARPATPETAFNIASVTKLFTGAALVALAESGALDLDDTLLEWLPDFPNPEQAAEISIRQLVNHTSGLNDYTAADLDRWEATGEALEPAFVLDYLAERPLDFEPGAHWSYTNSGFYLAGMVIERASGQAWADFVKESILDPLGLESVFLCDEVRDEAAVGYELIDSALRPANLYLEAGIRGDGGLCASVLDLVRYPALLETGRVLSPTALDEMLSATTLTTGVPVPYGMGVRRGHLQGRSAWGHTGGHAGTVAVVSRYPDEDVTIAVLTNTIRSERDALTLLGEVVAEVLDLATTEPEGVAVHADALLPYVGRYWGGRSGTQYDVSVESGRLRISQVGSDTSTEFAYLGDHTFVMIDGDYPLDRYVFHYHDGQSLAYSGFYNGLAGAFRQRVTP